MDRRQVDGNIERDTARDSAHGELRTQDRGTGSRTTEQRAQQERSDWRAGLMAC